MGEYEGFEEGQWIWCSEGNSADDYGDFYTSFDNAGSLCHDWSTLPIYYYHTLKAETGEKK